MKVYQLAASGHWILNHARFTAYSDECYPTKEAAKEAMPEFFIQLTTPKRNGDDMILDKENLRIFIHPLELVGNKKKA